MGVQGCLRQHGDGLTVCSTHDSQMSDVFMLSISNMVSSPDASTPYHQPMLALTGADKWATRLDSKSDFLHARTTSNIACNFMSTDIVLCACSYMSRD